MSFGHAPEKTDQKSGFSDKSITKCPHHLARETRLLA
jgi:hypothetical protein